MKLIFTLFGHTTVEIEADKEQDLIKQASFWQSLPEVCPIGGSTIHLQYRMPQGNHYYELVCECETKHEVELHQNKPDKGGGLYYLGDKDWKVAYSERGNQQNESARYSGETRPPMTKTSNTSQTEQPKAESPKDRIAAALKEIRKLDGKPVGREKDESDENYVNRLKNQYRQLRDAAEPKPETQSAGKKEPMIKPQTSKTLVALCDEADISEIDVCLETSNDRVEIFDLLTEKEALAAIERVKEEMGKDGEK